MKTLCKCLGGSNMYGLATPESDEDIRGVYMSTDIGEILGLDKNDFQERKDEGEDFKLYELRKYLSMLRKGNTESLELLYHDDWIEKDPAWDLVQSYRNKLCSSEQVMRVLTGGPKANYEQGYIYSERRLALGERTGRLGSKRKNSIEKHGFSPKNVCQILRLSYCGQTFFKTGIFPARLPQEWIDPILRIKTKPELFSIEEIEAMINISLHHLIKAFQNRTYEGEFSLDAANEICYRLYSAELEEYRLKKIFDPAL